MSKESIVTGGAGFIGSHLVDRLVDTGHKVTVIDNFSTGDKKNLEKSWDRIKVVEYDLSRGYPKNLSADYIFHLAALPRVQLSVDQPFESYQSNVTTTMNALEMSRELKVQKFIFASSSSITGEQERQPVDEEVSPNPQNPYAYYKLLGEHLIEMYSKIYGLSAIAFRFFNAYGPRMSETGAYKLVFSIWLEQIRNQVPLTITGDGEQTRDFTYVSDLVEGMVAGADNAQLKGFQVINLGSGEECSINRAAQLFGYESVHIPPRDFEEKRKKADITKARRLLGWSPSIDVEEGISIIKETYDLL